MENSSYKSNNVENRSTTTWTKRKIIKNDDLANLESLITLSNVDAKSDFRVQISNCECSGACQNNCVNGCGGNCQYYCTTGCRAACQNNCVNNSN